MATSDWDTICILGPFEDVQLSEEEETEFCMTFRANGVEYKVELDPWRNCCEQFGIDEIDLDCVRYGYGYCMKLDYDPDGAFIVRFYDRQDNIIGSVRFYNWHNGYYSHLFRITMVEDDSVVFRSSL